MFKSFFERKANAVYNQASNEIEKYKEDNLAFLFSEDVKESVVFDQWASLKES